MSRIAKARDAMTPIPPREKTRGKATRVMAAAVVKPVKARNSSGRFARNAPVPKDGNAQLTTAEDVLLDRARMQWQFGDWESLVALGMQTVEQHPQRAFLAMLVATAHQQIHDQEAARRFVICARDWGCDRRVMARLLIASVHNTLGRVAAVRQDETRALAYFKAAVDGAGGDVRLACQARSIAEIARLNLVDQAMRMIRAQQTDTGRAGWLESPQALLPGEETPSVLRDAGYAVPTRAGRAIPPANFGSTASRTHSAIVIAGMRHSGSTALFNVVRLALEQHGTEFTSLYSDGKAAELLSDPDQKLLLIKTHELRDDIASRASVVITCRRDIRDAVASAKRRGFPLLERLAGPVEYAKYNRALHDIWLPYSDYEFVYESYIADPVTETRKLLHFLGLQSVDVEAVCAGVASLPSDQYETTLLSSKHITDPDRVMYFGDTLDKAQVDKISADHATWLRRYGYKPADRRR